MEWQAAEAARWWVSTIWRCTAIANLDIHIVEAVITQNLDDLLAFTKVVQPQLR